MDDRIEQPSSYPSKKFRQDWSTDVGVLSASVVIVLDQVRFARFATVVRVMVVSGFQAGAVADRNLANARTRQTRTGQLPPGDRSARDPTLPSLTIGAAASTGDCPWFRDVLTERSIQDRLANRSESRVLSRFWGTSVVGERDAGGVPG